MGNSPGKQLNRSRSRSKILGSPKHKGEKGLKRSKSQPIEPTSFSSPSSKRPFTKKDDKRPIDPDEEDDDDIDEADILSDENEFIPSQEEDEDITIVYNEGIQILPKQKLLLLQLEVLRNAQDMCDVTLPVAAILLHHFKWDKDKLIEKWIDNIEDVCNMSGVFLPFLSKRSDATNIDTLFIPFKEDDRPPPPLLPSISDDTVSGDGASPSSSRGAYNMRLLDLIRPFLVHRALANTDSDEAFSLNPLFLMGNSPSSSSSARRNTLRHLPLPPASPRISRRATPMLPASPSIEDMELAAVQLSLVSQVQEVFPELDESFVSACLREYSNNYEVAVDHILEGNLPPYLLERLRTLRDGAGGGSVVVGEERDAADGEGDREGEVAVEGAGGGVDEGVMQAGEEEEEDGASTNVVSDLQYHSTVCASHTEDFTENPNAWFTATHTEDFTENPNAWFTATHTEDYSEIPNPWFTATHTELENESLDSTISTNTYTLHHSRIDDESSRLPTPVHVIDVKVGVNNDDGLLTSENTSVNNAFDNDDNDGDDDDDNGNTSDDEEELVVRRKTKGSCGYDMTDDVYDMSEGADNYATTNTGNISDSDMVDGDGDGDRDSDGDGDGNGDNRKDEWVVCESVPFDVNNNCGDVNMIGDVYIPRLGDSSDDVIERGQVLEKDGEEDRASMTYDGIIGDIIVANDDVICDASAANDDVFDGQDFCVYTAGDSNDDVCVDCEFKGIDMCMKDIVNGIVDSVCRCNSYEHTQVVNEEEVEEIEGVGMLEENREGVEEGEEKQESVLKDEELVTCPVCYTDAPVSETYGLACDHVYCLDCWRGHLLTKLGEGLSSALSAACMNPHCKLIVDISVWRKLLEEQQYLKYQWFFLKSFIDNCPKAVWCSNPVSCSNAAYYGGVDIPSILDIKCECGWKFCFHCGEEAHQPATCKQLTTWQALGSGEEGQNALWLSQNTKRCPVCKIHIEKNEGCMHMTCKGCQNEFCWLCKGSWAEHGDKTGGYYSCNRYDPLKHDTPDLDMRFGKYVHHFQRYKYHTNARKFAENCRPDISSKEPSRLPGDEPWDRAFLYDVLELVISCRNVLKFTYVFGFYLEESKEKELFEFLQEDLEKSTEYLTELLFREVDNISVPISERDSINTFKTSTKATRKFLHNLLSGIQNGLTADYGPPSDIIAARKGKKLKDRKFSRLLTRPLSRIIIYHNNQQHGKERL